MNCIRRTESKSEVTPRQGQNGEGDLSRVCASKSVDELPENFPQKNGGNFLGTEHLALGTKYEV